MDSTGASGRAQSRSGSATAQAWRRQIEWGMDLQWIGIGYSASEDAARHLMAEIETCANENGLRVRTVSGTNADTLFERLQRYTGDEQPDILVIDASALAPLEVKHVVLGVNRGRERVRRMARTGIVLMLPTGNKPVVRDLAPDLRSAAGIVTDVE